MSNNILKELKVIEIGTHVAIPYFTRVLGEWGADVVKIEPPRGESYRHIGKLFHMPHEEDNNVMFIPYNVNKKSLCLNLKNKDGLEVLLKLLEDADIFATNTRLAALEQLLGFNIKELREKYPRLIVVHLDGFGEKGAENERPGYDLASFWCRGGAIGEWTNAEDRPFKPFYGFGDAISSTHLLAGTMSALYNREKTGKGEVVRVSLYSAGLWTNVAGVLRGQPEFGQSFPKSRMNPILPTDNFHKTKDGKWIFISEEHWEKKCDAYFDIIGKPELKGNPDYCTLAGVFQRLPEMVQLFDEGFAKVTSQELADMLTSIDTVYEFISMPGELYSNQQAWDNGFLQDVKAPNGIKFIIPTNPIRFDNQEPADLSTAPLLGQHSVEVLKDLGYSDERINGFIENKSVYAK